MSRVDEIMTLISYYGAELTDKQVDLYLDALADMDISSLHAGIVDLIKTSKWMPKVSEIRQAAQAAQERSYDGKVLALHDSLIKQRLASPWVRIGLGAVMAGSVTPVIEWKSCPNGHEFANWTSCPECNEDAR